MLQDIIHSCVRRNTKGDDTRIYFLAKSVNGNLYRATFRKNKNDQPGEDKILEFYATDSSYNKKGHKVRDGIITPDL